MIGMTVCSGLGTPELAAPWIDWRLASEIEPFPRAILEQKFGYRCARRGLAARLLWSDFTALKPRHFRRLGVPLPDLLVAGTPCQSFSIAGLRGGLADARGNLTLAFVRLADAIDNARIAAGLPGLVILWENVPGILSHKDNPFGCFLGALVGSDTPLVPGRKQRWTDSGLVVGPRRAAAWRTLDAQYFGLAQRRARVFVVVCPRDGADPAEILFEPEGLRRHSPPSREAEQDVARPVAAGTPGGSGYRNDADTAENLIAHTLSAARGTACAHAADLETYIPMAFGGNDTRGPIDIATAVNAHGGPHGRLDFESETFIAHSLRGEGFDASEDGTGRGTPLVPVAFAQNSRSEVRAIDGDGGIVGALASDHGAQQQNYIAFNARQDPDSDPATHPLDTDGHSIAIAFSAKDHGADAGAVAPTLRSGGHAESHANGGVMPAVTDMQGVRRLLPVECERLQGLPDHHTHISWRGHPPEDCPDGPRYRAIGNGMARPVLEWLISRIRPPKSEAA